MFELYGRKWPEDTSRLTIELTAYRWDFQPADGGLGKLAHFKNAFALAFPNMLSTYCSWSEQMLTGFVNNSKVGGGYLSVLGGSGCGKSYFMGYLVILDWMAAPNDTIALCASTTLRDLTDRIWKTVRKGYEEFPADVGKFYKSKPEKLISPNMEGSVQAIALDDDRDGEKLKGFHPKRLRIIVDEATAFSPAVLASQQNWASANKEFILVCLSNFKGFDNLCSVVSEPVHGYHSINYDDTQQWKTKMDGECILFDLTKSPVYENEKMAEKLPFIRGRKQIDKVIYGEGDIPGLGIVHPRVMQYIRSVPVFDEGAKTVLNNKLVEVSRCREKAEWIGWGQTKIAALDPAFVTGGDKCVLQFGTLGYELDGVQTLQADEKLYLEIDSSPKARKPVEYQILEQVVVECQKRGIEPQNFIMDSCGTGRGLGSIFQYEWSSEIMLMDPRLAASDSIVDFDFMKKGKEIYDRLTTELNWEVRRYIETSQLRGLKGPEIEQFCTRLYDDSRVKMRLETKTEYKERTSGEESATGSPDDSDVITYLLYLAKDIGFKLQRRDPRYREYALERDAGKSEAQIEVEKWYNERVDAWEGQRGVVGDEGGLLDEADYSGDPFDA